MCSLVLTAPGWLLETSLLFAESGATAPVLACPQTWSVLWQHSIYHLPGVLSPLHREHVLGAIAEAEEGF